jgi:serine palmitoyltransferase
MPASLPLASVETEIPEPFVPAFALLASAYRSFVNTLTRIPGSPIIIRYIESSYQNDPYRSLLEVLLVAFAVRTLLKGRTRGDASSKNWVKLREDVSYPFTPKFPVGGTGTMDP